MSSIWSRLINLAGNITGVLPIANGGTNASTKAAAFDNLSPMSSLGDIIYGGASGSGTALAAGASTHVVLHSGSASPPSWGQVVLTSEVSGVLPATNGGTGQSAAWVAGGIVYGSSTSALAITSAGTAQNWVLSGGTGTPTMSNTTTTGKFVDGSADEIQMRVQGNSTQTSTIVSVEKSDTTSLFAVTNVNGSNIRGTTTNDSAAAGFVGEVISASLVRSSAVSLTTNTAVNAVSIAVTAGDWLISASADIRITNATLTDATFSISSSAVAGSGVLSGADTIGTPSSSGEYRGISSYPTTVLSSDITQVSPSYRLSLSAGVTLYLVVRAVFSAGSATGSGYIQALRVR